MTIHKDRKEVFCNGCKYMGSAGDDGYIDVCEHPKNTNIVRLSTHKYNDHKRCKDANENNDCKLFEQSLLAALFGI